MADKNLKKEEELRQIEIKNGYEPAVYENSCVNLFKILGMFILFYGFTGLHFYAYYGLGITNAAASTGFGIFFFALSVIIIFLMLIKGTKVRKL